MAKVRTFADLDALADEASARSAAMRRVRLDHNLAVIAGLSSGRSEEAKAFIQRLSRTERADLLDHAPDLAGRLTGFHDLNVIAYGARALLATRAAQRPADVNEVQRRLARVSLARVSVPPAARPELTRRLKDIDEAQGFVRMLTVWAGYRIRRVLRAVGRALSPRRGR